MVAYYRLKELGFRVAPGAFVMPAAEVDSMAQASALIDAARDEAVRIAAEAVEAREAEKKRGFEEGVQEAQLAAMEQLLRENIALDSRLQQIEKDLTGLVLACTRKLVAEFDDVARAESIVRSALKTMRRQKRAELRVPAALYPHFRACAARLADDFPDIELLDVVEDAALAKDQIIVETPVGRVEGDLTRRLTDIEALLRGVHASAQEQAKGFDP